MQKILIANRGEIALRIMRTIRRMGLQSVAVFSEADRQSPHVRYADEAVLIGEAPSSKSYLDGDKIIEVCKKLNVDAIHPGYGFLSENPAFAKKVQDAGIIFIGPSAHAMEIMGSKLAAKQNVMQYNIPMVPGTEDAVKDVATAKQIAAQVGYPVLIKAVAGGGGKGMHIVQNEEELSEQLERAISVAASAFGDGSVFLEKYIPVIRHIEIQVLADNYGNTIHLFERECSIQRRHQKVIEESPSVIMTPELREKMGKAAVDVARSCNYSGTGTVEFIVDDKLNFYFLEMNTRLQVEHPVTEFITGIDLVEEQIRVARGEKLRYAQEELKIKGHAIELRVYAEDPNNDFLPSEGTLEKYLPPTMTNVRVDDGYEQGMEVPIYYDPMLAKLIAYGATRSEAIELLKKAIKAYKVEGVETTLPFGTFVLENPAFVNGNFDTAFVKKHYTPQEIASQKASKNARAATAALLFFKAHQEKLSLANHQPTNWKIRKA